MTSAYLGPPGTHTHRAALTFASEEQLKAYHSIPALTTALDKGEATQAILPLENSLEGTVSATLDYLIGSSKKIVSEVVLDIDHVLVSLGGIELEDIEIIASHPQALAQCSAFINSLSVLSLPTTSTVAAIDEVRKNSNMAAIVSGFAANIYSLKILATNISDLEANSTRFCLLSDIETHPTGNDKTSILFEIPDKPGSLFEILGLFSDASINLTKIESRPAKYRLGKYLFAIDFIGHKNEDKIKNILMNLQQSCIWLKILGSYPIYDY